jgi:PPOX class probable F420-dependent enzyme
MTTREAIAGSKYVNLTTYRKDGTTVATPVWHVAYDGKLFVVSEAASWKVKRIRNNNQVTVTVCDFRGNVKPGAPSASGTARLLDATGTATARRLLAQKYVTSRIGNWFARLLRIRRPEMVGIEVTF